MLAERLGWGGVLVLLPALVLATWLGSRVRNLPYADQWGPSASIAIATQSGELQLGQIFKQHNEHRIVFTHLATVLATRTTDWDTRVES